VSSRLRNTLIEPQHDGKHNNGYISTCPSKQPIVTANSYSQQLQTIVTANSYSQ